MLVAIRGIIEEDDQNGDGKLSPIEARQFKGATFHEIDRMDQEDGYITTNDLHKFLGCN